MATCTEEYNILQFKWVSLSLGSSAASSSPEEAETTSGELCSNAEEKKYENRHTTDRVIHLAILLLWPDDMREVGGSHCRVLSAYKCVHPNGWNSKSNDTRHASVVADGKRKSFAN